MVVPKYGAASELAGGVHQLDKDEAAGVINSEWNFSSTLRCTSARTRYPAWALR